MLNKKRIISGVLLAILIVSLLALTSCLDMLCQHEESHWVTEREATKTEEGIKKSLCNECGEVLKTEKIPRIKWEEAEISESLADSIFKVYVYTSDGLSITSQGSGFFIDENGTFLTNAHVVKDAFVVRIQTNDGKFYNVDKMYEYEHTSSDYAICHAEIAQTKPVKFSESLKKTDTVYALGYPNDAVSLVISTGEVESELTKGNGISYYGTNAKINQGSSGGVLSNAYGEVVGITTCIFDNGNYGSIRYPDIKSVVQNEHNEGKAPYEFFYTKSEVLINSDNVEEYFEILIGVTPALATNQIYYDVTLRIKNDYISLHPAPEGEFTLKFKINTVCDYKTVFDVEKRSEGSREIDTNMTSSPELVVGKKFALYMNIPSDAWGEIAANASSEFLAAEGKLVLYTRITNETNE